MTETIISTPGLGKNAAGERLFLRRLVVFGLCAGSWLMLGAGMSLLLGASGWSWPRVAILLLFLAGLPWTLLAFWNSVIGFLILCLVRDPAGYTNPALRATPLDSPIVTRTAICLMVRHEHVARVFARLETMIGSLGAAAEHFAFHILSDSSRPEIAAAEEQAFATIRARHAQPGFLHYRRRAANIGFKAGNLREFAERAVGAYEHMIVLDADSLMSGAAMLRLVRAMQANPTLGILQTLVDRKSVV